MIDVEKNHRADRGKWAQAGVPKKGWVCDGVEDMGEPSEICEMCETSEIRYVHCMSHQDYPEGLRVGCVCAEHMEEDYKNPKLRERKAKSLAKQKKNWPSRKWHYIDEDYSYSTVSGFRIQISPWFFKKTNGKKSYRITVINKKTGLEKQGRKVFPSMQEAKDAALEAYIWAHKNL